MFHSHDVGQFEVQAEQMFNHPAYPGSNGMANDVALIQVPDLSQHANADSAKGFLLKASRHRFFECHT